MDSGEFPGYEFEVPSGRSSGPRHAIGHDSRHAIGHDSRPVMGYDSRPVIGHDSLQQLRHAAQHAQPRPRSALRSAGGGVFAVMRRRNWLLGLAAPILAALAVGIAAVVVTGGGGGGGSAPSALAACFSPARLAGANFTGNARVVLSAIGASAATEVAAGSANGGPALWVSADGGSSWSRAELELPASGAGAASGQLAGVAHGAAGWLAVGTTLAAGGGPLLASSADARTWSLLSGLAGQPGARGETVTASAVAAGPAGYVIVGRESAGNGGQETAAAWSASGVTSLDNVSWHSAAVTGPAGAAGQMMTAVTATSAGFVAVGGAGTSPAAWVSAAGQSWRQVTLPGPAGAERAALDYVAASGASVVAAGTEFTAAGASRPFAEVSADGGRSWSVLQLPVPDIGPGTGTTVTALTAAGGGFTAAGTYLTAAGPEVVLWTLPPGSGAAAAGAWSAVTPQGTGLASREAESAITALTADGATLSGVGFTATVSASGTPGPQQPTLWQSPIRY
jgi:hypothetical protein